MNRQGEPIILFNPIPPELWLLWKLAIDFVLMGELKNGCYLLPFNYRNFDIPFQKCSMRSTLQSISFLCKLMERHSSCLIWPKRRLYIHVIVSLCQFIITLYGLVISLCGFIIILCQFVISLSGFIFMLSHLAFRHVGLSLCYVDFSCRYVSLSLCNINLLFRFVDLHFCYVNLSFRYGGLSLCYVDISFRYVSFTLSLCYVFASLCFVIVSFHYGNLFLFYISSISLYWFVIFLMPVLCFVISFFFTSLCGHIFR